MSLHHEVSRLHWLFLIRVHTAVAAYSRGSCSFDHTLSTAFLELFSAASIGPECVVQSTSNHWAVELPCTHTTFELALLHLLYAVTDHQLMLDAFLRWNDFYNADCTSESLSVNNVVYRLSKSHALGVSLTLWTFHSRTHALLTISHAFWRWSRISGNL